MSAVRKHDTKSGLAVRHSSMRTAIILSLLRQPSDEHQASVAESHL
jgi:hypothetical protein